MAELLSLAAALYSILGGRDSGAAVIAGILGTRHEGKQEASVGSQKSLSSFSKNNMKGEAALAGSLCLNPKP